MPVCRTRVGKSRNPYTVPTPSLHRPYIKLNRVNSTVRQENTMIEVLKWIHESFGHYVSFLFLTLWIDFLILIIAVQFRSIGRPHKNVSHSIKDTQKL